MAKKKLGKGLEALIKSYGKDEKEQYLNNNVPIEKIIPNKNQPRQIFNEKEMNELADSIKKIGIIQPITIRPIKNDMFEIIAGERRYRASKIAQLKKIPAYILDIKTDGQMMEYALIENIQRVDLNPIEEAEGYAVLSGKYGLTHIKIAKCVSKSRTEISNKLRLLKLPPIVKDSLRDGDIEYGHARALLRLKESKKIINLFKKIINKKLTVRQTENFIKKLLIPNDDFDKKSKTGVVYFEDLSEDIQKYLNAKTIIRKKKTGEIIINFSDEEDLKRIVKKIKNKFFI